MTMEELFDQWRTNTHRPVGTVSGLDIFRGGYAARAAEGGVVLDAGEVSTLLDALALFIAPIEIVDHRFMLQHGIITETEVYAIHPTSRIGERILALRAKLEHPHADS